MYRPHHHPATLCVHAGAEANDPGQGVNTPVYTSSAFGYLDTEENQYPRYYNTPNQRTVVKKLCALEQGEAGLLFGSGMAAISTTLLALLQAGDHIILQNDLYGGTYHFITTDLERLGIAYTLVDTPDATHLEAALRPTTRVIYVETPSNPLLKITDLRAVADLAKTRGLLSVIDNTFASPVNQNPIALGIDVVIHSGTKYLGGHSDLCFGAVVTSATLRQQILERAINLGGSINAATCALIERSLKTLHLRVQQQNHNAQVLAEFLQQHTAVRRVNYPGLPSHEGYAMAQEQMIGFGGMLSFEVDVPGLTEAVALMRRLRMITPAISLGGVETLICSPAQTSHSKLSSEQRRKAGVSDALLRVSVGIEHVDDLVEESRTSADGNSNGRVGTSDPLKKAVHFIANSLSDIGNLTIKYLARKGCRHPSVYIKHITGTLRQVPASKGEYSIGNVFGRDDLIEQGTLRVKGRQFFYGNAVSFRPTLGPLPFPNLAALYHGIRVHYVDANFVFAQLSGEQSAHMNLGRFRGSVTHVVGA